MPPEIEEVEEETPVVENEEVDETEEEIEEEEPETPTVNSQAQALYELLQNPATAKSTLSMIASNLGMSISETRTQEGQKAIKDVIKEALGEDLAFLGDKLGPLGDAIEKLINTRISKVEQDANERVKTREAAEFEVQSQNAMIKLGRETKGEFDNLLPKINKLMEEIPIGKSVTPESYLRRLYTIAKSEASNSERSPSERTEKARRESRNNSTQTTTNATRIKNGSSKLPSIREAVLAAARGEKLD